MKAMGFDQVVKKVSSIIENQYGCKLEVVLARTSPKKSTLLDVSYRNRKARAVVSGVDLVIPLTVSGDFLGAAVARGGARLKIETMNRVIEIVHMILGQALKTMDRSELLIETESKLAPVELPPNVISLNKYRSRKRTSPGLAKRKNAFSTPTPLYLEGDKNFPYHKLAVDIHNKSNAHSFVSWLDLDPNSISKISDLKEMGRVTIFIPEVSKLSPNHQLLLLEYLKEARRLNLPSVIAISTISLEQLHKSSKISKALFQQLLRIRIRINPMFKRRVDLLRFVEAFCEAYNQNKGALQNFQLEALLSVLASRVLKKGDYENNRRR